MHHINEHTLELYVLQAKEVEEKRHEIEDHLAGCHGCRELVEEMSAFHAELKEELKEVPSFESSDETALVRRNVSPVPFYDTYAPPAVYRPTTLVGRFFYFVRRHPIAAGAGSFVTMGVVAAALFLTVLRPANQSNPTRWQYNVASSTIDVYDDHYALLWQIPSPDVTQENIHREGSFFRTVLADLDGDGKNEIITTHFLVGDQYTTNQHGQKLSLIDVAAKKVLWEIPFVDSVNYLDRPYSQYYNADMILVVDVEKRRGKEILVSANNIGRSPSYIARLDSRGNILGQYWHFGSLVALYAVDVDGDGRNEVIACGVNDTQDTTQGEFPMAVVLDPRMITGKTRSSVCPGLVLSPSGAEINYIRFPQSDINVALRQSSFTEFALFDSPDVLQFHVSSTLPDGTQWHFHYYFSRQMVPLYVKSENTTDRLHAKLRDEGKVTGTIDNAYLENLKNGIRYWDGREWRKEVTRVRQPLP